MGQTLYDASEGRIGRGIDVGDIPNECQIVLGSQQRWLSCSDAWQKVLTKDSSPPERMWAITAALRAEEYELAFREFEPLLSHIEKQEGDYWSYLILESWILSTLNLHQEALSLLKSVPKNALDWEGRNIVYANILHRQHRFVKRDRFWLHGVNDSGVGAWTWWHKAQWSNSTDSKKEVLEQALQFADATPVHFLELINLAISAEHWKYALDTTLVGLSLHPESTSLLQKGIVVAQQSEVSSQLNSMVDSFPEHTKLRLLKGAVLLYQQDFQRSWDALFVAQELGESSKLFYSLKISVAKAISEQLHHQTLQEAIILYPEQGGWKAELKKDQSLKNKSEAKPKE